MSLPRSLSTHAIVTYCCGACGYDLNLSSSDRNTANIVGAKYGKSIRKGVVTFVAIDDARFGHVDEFRCLDVSAGTWRLFARRTRLLCRKCGGHLGFSYRAPAAAGGGEGGERYDIKIGTLQPVSSGSA